MHSISVHYESCMKLALKCTSWRYFQHVIVVDIKGRGLSLVRGLLHTSNHDTGGS